MINYLIALYGKFVCSHWYGTAQRRASCCDEIWSIATCDGYAYFRSAINWACMHCAANRMHRSFVCVLLHKMQMQMQRVVSRGDIVCRFDTYGKWFLYTGLKCFSAFIILQRGSTYLDCLIFERMIGIVHILQRYAVELSLVDVRDAIVFASLGWTDRALQVVAEALRREAKNRKNVCMCNADGVF